MRRLILIFVFIATTFFLSTVIEAAESSLSGTWDGVFTGKGAANYTTQIIIEQRDSQLYAIARIRYSSNSDRKELCEALKGYVMEDGSSNSGRKELWEALRGYVMEDGSVTLWGLNASDKKYSYDRFDGDIMYNGIAIFGDVTDAKSDGTFKFFKRNSNLPDDFKGDYNKKAGITD